MTLTNFSIVDAFIGAFLFAMPAVLGLGLLRAVLFGSAAGALFGVAKAVAKRMWPGQKKEVEIQYEEAVRLGRDDINDTYTKIVYKNPDLHHVVEQREDEGFWHVYPDESDGSQTTTLDWRYDYVEEGSSSTAYYEEEGGQLNKVAVVHEGSSMIPF